MTPGMNPKTKPDLVHNGNFHVGQNQKATELSPPSRINHHSIVWPKLPSLQQHYTLWIHVKKKKGGWGVPHVVGTMLV